MSSGCDVGVWCKEAFQNDSAALCVSLPSCKRDARVFCV